MRFGVLLGLALIACGNHGPSLHGDPQALAYRSRDKVSDSAAVKIASEAAADATKRPSWNESNHVHCADGPFGDGRDKYVYGEARLHLDEYEPQPGKFREVDAHDDAVMAYADAVFTVGQLTRWAAESGAKFEVRLGRSHGEVTAQGPDEKAREMLDKLSQRAGGISAQQAEQSRAAIDAKYHDRH
jgi:hypothetical protein